MSVKKSFKSRKDSDRFLFVMSDCECGYMLCLNNTSAMILGMCDGNNSISDTAKQLSLRYNISYEKTLQDVTECECISGLENAKIVATNVLTDNCQCNY
ncbi:MAG: PqqD family protein [Clostridiales bacterium]|nr:PqqD family protein [Clostridiales bacterium]